jgi:hypothetical protein
VGLAISGPQIRTTDWIDQGSERYGDLIVGPGPASRVIKSAIIIMCMGSVNSSGKPSGPSL